MIESLTFSEREMILQKYCETSDIQKVYSSFIKSDLENKKFILDFLCRYDGKGTFTSVFQEALRTNHKELFVYVSQQTTYPALYFDERAYNQMILKALFLDLDISLIPELSKRRNEQLNIMIKNYQEELELAGRRIPEGINFYFKG